LSAQETAYIVGFLMTDQLLHGHLAFRRRSGTERDYLLRLAVEGQKPQALFIGCSDSRVIPELLTGANAGELFVVRNIANHVPPSENADSSVGAAIDYAVGVLGVQDVIVCGHSGCGGVRAALAGVDTLPANFDNLREWVGNIVTAIEGAVAAHHAEHDLSDRAVEENVLTSVDNLMTYGAVAARVAAGSIALHAWVYDLESLELRVYDADVNSWSDARALVAPSSV
jgi:carbonic anhydrase